MIPPSLLHTLGQASRKKEAQAFIRDCAQPDLAQRARLDWLLTNNQDTAFGKQHGFSDIPDAHGYRERVPLMRPAELLPWVERQMKGEPNVLTREDPEYFVRTTGSTGVPKHVPITPTYRTEFQRTVFSSVWHIYRRYPAAFKGRILYFVGSPQLDVTDGGVPIGTMSGYNFVKMPGLVRALYAWPPELFSVADLSTRNYIALHLAATSGVTVMAGIFPASVVYLFRDLEERIELLAHHVKKGTLPDELVLTDAQRAFFQKQIRPSKKHGDRLAQAAKQSRGGIVPTVLDQLKLAYCWTTSTAGAFLPELRAHFGDEIIIRDAIYSACEGWCNVPLGEPTPGGPLAVRSHFFEFIPEDKADEDQPETLLAQELEVGERYLIVFSTAGGVYRYRLGDVVEVSSRFEQTPVIHFVRKLGAACNLVGEKLEEVHVAQAVREVFGDGLTYYVLAPRAGDVPGYDLYVEGASDGDWSARTAAIDVALGKAAPDYGRLRQGQSLGPVRTLDVPAGTYRADRQRLSDLGTAESQIKTAHLVDDQARVPVLVKERAAVRA